MSLPMLLLPLLLLLLLNNGLVIDKDDGKSGILFVLFSPTIADASSIILSISSLLSE